MWPQLLRCGNSRHQTERLKIPQASMWPQLLRCGNYISLYAQPCALYTLQCGRNFCVAEMYQSHIGAWSWGARFNVAATFALRKVSMAYSLKVVVTLLQCGRNFCVAEMDVYSPNVCMIGAASMWPQLLRCGNYCKENIEYLVEQASMWPQLLRCGNPRYPAAVQVR